MALKLYVDRMSQPSRAVLIFCKINGIEFEEILVDIAKNKQLSPEFKAINPFCQVPTITDGRFKLFESHAILIYICCAFPGVASHWYPSDPFERTKIHSVLDWHHSNLRQGSGDNFIKYLPFYSKWLYHTLGFILSASRRTCFEHHPCTTKWVTFKVPQAVKELEKLLVRSLFKLEDFWLIDGPFLLGRSQPSIADISLACEVMQLELLSEKDHDRILKPYKKVVQWIEDTKRATAPHFDEVHEILFKVQKKLRGRRETESVKNELQSML